MLLLLASLAAAECRPAEELSVRSELLLGRNRAGRPYVSAARFERFLQERVTPTFPGFTVLDAQGYWEGAAEGSRVLVILHAPAATPAVETLADAYRQDFSQESVLVVHVPVTTLNCEASP